MEEDELEMTKGELQKWIQGEVNQNRLISDMVEKCDLLQSLLDRRKNQATQLRKLYESVVECEEIVKKQYSLLGWEYRDTDSDDDNAEGCGSTPPSSPEFLHTETCVPSPPPTICSTPLLPNPEDSENIWRDNDEKLVNLKRQLVSLKRQPVVLLTRLSPRKSCSFRPPAPQDPNNEDESFDDSGSASQWEPEEDSSYSDHSFSSFNAGSNKRRKIDPENEEPAKSPARPEVSTDTVAKSIAAKSSDAQTNLTEYSGTKSNTAENTGAKSMAAKSYDAKSNTPRSTRPKGFATKSTGAKWNAAKSSDAKSIAVKSSDAKGITAKGSDAKSITAKGSDAKSIAARSSDTKSNTTKSTRPKGFAAKSTGVKCNAAKSSDAKNMASKSSDAKNMASKSSDTKSIAAKSSDMESNTPKSTGAKGFAVKSTGAKCNAARTSTPQASANTNAKSNRVKTSTPPAKSNGVTPVGTETKDPPSLLKISVNMNVLARRKGRDWQRGKILEMVTKDNGRLKYKIGFEEKEKSKSLVSGNHIAFDRMPQLDQLDVGTRVVVKCTGEEPRFCPGFVAELPNRKNRMRFLVFLDDQTPVYVGLPLLHLVCRPLADPLDDIPDENHKEFMKTYLEAQPYPPQTQYRVGQNINAEFEGVQQKCEVLKVDCSLIQVVFEKDKHKEWIYRGSYRLEHMMNMMAQLGSKKDAGQEIKATTVNESSKSA